MSGSVQTPNIPDALRYPGVYINIDGSQAGLGGDLPAVLLVGYKLPVGIAPVGELVLAAGADDVKAKVGEGSMLHQMYTMYRKGEKAFDVYMLPYADLPAGVAATGTITVDTPPTEDGVIPLYISTRLVQVGVTAGQAVADIATAIADAITAAGLDIPVTVAAAGAVATLTARNKGTTGNDIDVRLSLYGETLPDGLGLTIDALADGAGNPLVGDLETIIGERRFRYVALGISDAVTLAAWHAESQRRYLPPVQAGFRAFSAYRGDYEAAYNFGSTKNYEHISDTAIALLPFTTWEAAAALCAAADTRLYNNPVQSLEGAPLPGLVGVDTEYFTWTQKNSLLFKGMSLIEVGKDGACYIKRLISMYQFKPDGSADDAFLDINTAEGMDRTREKQIAAINKACVGTVAAKTNEGFAPGLKITTEDSIKALLLSLYSNVLVRQLGWAQAYDYYKSTLLVAQDPLNPSRFNFNDQPVLNSPYYIVAGNSAFLKAVPAY